MRSTSSSRSLNLLTVHQRDSQRTRYDAMSSVSSHVLTAQMLPRTALRASKAPSMIASRGFRTSAARLSSPYHYPEGPRSNLPFNPLTKYFALRYWGTMGKPLEHTTIDDGADAKTKPSFLHCHLALRVGLSNSFVPVMSLTGDLVWQTKKNK